MPTYTKPQLEQQYEKLPDSLKDALVRVDARDMRRARAPAAGNQKALAQSHDSLIQTRMSGLRLPMEYLVGNDGDADHEDREKREPARPTDELKKRLNRHNDISYRCDNMAKYHAQKRNTATFKALCAITRILNPEGSAAAAPAVTNVATNHALEASRQNEERSRASVVSNFQRINI